MASGDFNWVDYARFINDWYQARQNKKNTGFKQTPMSPEQRQVWQYSFDKFKGLPDASADLYPTASYYAKAAPSIDVDAMKGGKTGYKTVPPPTPAQLSAIISGKGTPSSSPYTSPAAASPIAGINSVDREPLNNVGGTGDGIPGARSPIGDSTTYDSEGGYFRHKPGDVSTPGQITSMNPTGASGSQFQTGAQQGMPTNALGTPMQRSEGAAFQQFLSTYGRAAAMGVLAIMSQNPGMAFAAAVQAWRAHQATNPPQQGTGGSGFVPGHAGD